MTEKEFKRSVLSVTAFASFLTPFMGSSVNLALPAIGSELGLNAVTLNWVVSSYLLSTAIFLLPAGRLGDIIGRKKVFATGIFIFTLTLLLLSFSRNVVWLISLRILQGIASSMIFGTNMAILTSVFPVGERGKALGINVTSVYIGLSSGPFLGGLLTRYFGWRSIFAFLIPMGILSLILIKKRMKSEWIEARGEHFDWKGSLIWALSLAFIMYGFSKLPGFEGWLFTVAGFVLLPVFILIESRSSAPVFDISLIFRNRVFAFSSLASLIHYAATSAIGFFLSLFLQYIKGLGPREAGFILMSWPLMMALLSPMAGKLSDSKNPGILASTGMVITSAGLLSLCFLTINTTILTIVLILAAIGFGFALFSSPNTNAIMSSVEKKQLGNASSMIGTMRMLGQTLSMAITMMIIALYMGKGKITPENYSLFLSGMKTGFIIFSVLCIFGVFASLARNNDLKK